MRISVSSISANPDLARARQLLHPLLMDLKDRTLSLEISDPKYDYVLLSFIDKPASHFQKIRNRDRIYQVEVGYDEGVWKPATETARLVCYVAEKLIRAIGKSDLLDSNILKLHDLILEWGGLSETKQ